MDDDRPCFFSYLAAFTPLGLNRHFSLCIQILFFFCKISGIFPLSTKTFIFLADKDPSLLNGHVLGRLPIKGRNTKIVYWSDH